MYAPGDSTTFRGEVLLAVVWFTRCYSFVGFFLSFIEFFKFLFHVFCCCKADRRVYLAEEPTDDPACVADLALFTNGPDSAGFERWVEPEGLT
jgi:hypothetical protein